VAAVKSTATTVIIQPKLLRLPLSVSKYVGFERKIKTIAGLLFDNPLLLSYLDDSLLFKLSSVSIKTKNSVLREYQRRLAVREKEATRLRLRCYQLEKSRDMHAARSKAACKMLHELKMLLVPLSNANNSLLNNPNSLQSTLRNAIMQQRFDGVQISLKDSDGAVKDEYRDLLVDLWVHESVPMSHTVTVLSKSLEAAGFTVANKPSSTNSVTRMLMERDLVVKFSTAKTLIGQRNLTLGTDGTTTWSHRHFQTFYITCESQSIEPIRLFLGMPETQGKHTAEQQLELIDRQISAVSSMQAQLGADELDRLSLTSLTGLAVDNESTNRGVNNGLKAQMERKRLELWQQQVSKQVTEFKRHQIEVQELCKAMQTLDTSRYMAVVPSNADDDAWFELLLHEDNQPADAMLQDLTKHLIQSLKPLELVPCHMHVSNLIQKQFSRNLDEAERKDNLVENPSMQGGESFGHYAARMFYKKTKFSVKVDALLHVLHLEDKKRPRVALSRIYSVDKFGASLGKMWPSLMDLAEKYMPVLLDRYVNLVISFFGHDMLLSLARKLH
jgi:hypothetical protein